MAATTTRVAEYTTRIAGMMAAHGDFDAGSAYVIGMIEAWADPSPADAFTDAERLAAIRDALAALKAARAERAERAAQREESTRV